MTTKGSMNKTTKKHANLVIVGSGPVGMVAALMLKDQFEQVTLLERRSKENFLLTHGFTFPIVFSPAAIKVLERIGVWDAIKAERSEFFGVVIHKRILGKEFNITSKREGVYSHWRNHAVSALYKRVLEAGITIHFESQVEDIDFQNNVCREARLGNLPFDLLLGADGINSQTRKLMAKVHPEFSESDFKMIDLDNWYAYRLPARGALKDTFSGGDHYYSSNVFVDNLAAFPSDKTRIVTTGMRQPAEEISILIKYETKISLPRLKEMNDSFFGQYVEAKQELDRAWSEGYAGKFNQVHSPTFHLNNVLLVGDAAHGFESTGDLINLGITSIGSFYEIFNRQETIQGALKEYNDTVGESLRFYGRFSYRRSLEKISFEVSSIEFAHSLGLANRHPTLFGIYADDFELQSYMTGYRRDILKGRLLMIGLPITLVLLSLLLF